MSSCRPPLLNLRQRRIRGAGDRGQAESTRTRLLQECIQEANVANQAALKECKTTTVISQISPLEQQRIPASTSSNAFCIALTPVGNIYVLTTTSTIDPAFADTFSIQSYTSDGVLINATPTAISSLQTRAFWMVWDTYSSSIFVAAITATTVDLYKISSDLQALLSSISFAIASSVNISFTTNQMGRLFLYVNENGLYIYDTDLNNIVTPTSAPSPSIVDLGEPICDSFGNAYFPMIYSPTGNDQDPTNYISVIKYDSSANLLWETSFNVIEQQDDDFPTPSSLRIVNNHLILMYPSGYNLDIQNISFSGVVLSSATVDLSIYNPPSNLNSINSISVATNSNGRIFVAFQINYDSANSYLLEINEAGEILFTQSLPIQLFYYLCTQASTEYLWLFTSINEVTQYLLETSTTNICTLPCCPVLKQPLVQLPTAPDQLSHTLDIAVSCPILYNTPVTSYGAQPVYAVPIPPPTILDVGEVPEPPQGPAVVNVYRKFQRISGIDQISKPLVGRAGSDRTARIRAGIISGSLTRYVQTVLPLVAYPPCPPSPQAGVPQAGVPIAPNSGCNPGTRRVDYSNPRA